MPVDIVGKGFESQVVLASRGKSNSHNFSKVLDGAITRKSETQIKAGLTEKANQGSEGKNSYIELGRISKETPTVSHILKSNPEYSGKCWDIIFSSQNRGKPFTEMREGTLVSMRSGSQELVWGRALSKLADVAEAERTSGLKDNNEQSISMGTLSDEHPTVSHLFQADSQYAGQSWNIINDPINRGKQYTSLRPGTEVMLNPNTKEITFRNALAAGPIAANDRQKQEPMNIKQAAVTHESLADAVKPYMGIPYSKIDCYGLIVRGLQNQGINYKGQGGIREKLVMMAERNGLPRNSYFNGEGLVEKAGTKVYSKSMSGVSNARVKTEEIYSEMKPYLKEGFILSFSTSTKGHTGVISKQGGEWTYINSGLIDNHVSSSKISRRVGEEYLKAELNNWLAIASKNREPLTVTIGHIGHNETEAAPG